MLDIRLIRDNSEYVKERLNQRANGNTLMESIDKILDLDIKRRELIVDTESKKARMNTVNKSIPLLKKENKDLKSVFLELKNIGEEIKEQNILLKNIESELNALMMSIPNLPDESVPEGSSEEDNVTIRTFGTPREFDFDPKPHWDLGKELRILDSETAAKVSGSRFHFYKGAGAKLERALINYFLDTHSSKGYEEVFPPFMVNRDSMICTGQLPKFEEDAFNVTNNDFFLIPTAEVPITNIHRNEILAIEQLPIKYCAYSACFRAEAGSAGRDQRGLIRQHQFNKVELVTFCEPSKSFELLQNLTSDACAVLEGLGLPYRVSLLCSGDLGFSSAKTYDIEVWMPSYNRYVEISSCSCFTDFQARRGAIRYKKSNDDKAELLHTLNGSGVAVGRAVAAIIENYQNADGSISIPDVLIKYLGFDKISLS